MSANQHRDEAGVCDWCDADLKDLEEKNGHLHLRLHGMRVVKGGMEPGGEAGPDDCVKAEHGVYIKVKIRCAACGHVNVVMGHSPRPNLAPAPRDSLHGAS